MIVLVSLIVVLKGFPCFHDFCMVHLIPTSPFIQLNDFCTYFLWFAYIVIYNIIHTATCMRTWAYA